MNQDKPRLKLCSKYVLIYQIWSWTWQRHYKTKHITKYVQYKCTCNNLGTAIKYKVYNTQDWYNVDAQTSTGKDYTYIYNKDVHCDTHHNVHWLSMLWSYFNVCYAQGCLCKGWKEILSHVYIHAIKSMCSLKLIMYCVIYRTLGNSIVWDNNLVVCIQTITDIWSQNEKAKCYYK